MSIDHEWQTLLGRAKQHGWVLEPDAKGLLAKAGLPVPKYYLATDDDSAVNFAQSIGYPVAAKIVSPAVVHKTDQGGVLLGLTTQTQVRQAFEMFHSAEGFTGMLVEEMVSGVELLVGAKIDYQFGPVVILGIGGTGVEIYGDTTLRMAPVNEGDAIAMINGLHARELLSGFRGAEPIHISKLARLLVVFSQLVMTLADDIDSIDLNPVMCTAHGCTVADARIILKR